MKKAVDRVVLTAERRAEVARADLLATTTALRDRLHPRALAAEVAEGVLARANQLLDAASGTVKNRPVVSGASTIAFVAAVGLRWWMAKRKSQPAEETTRADNS